MSCYYNTANCPKKLNKAGRLNTLSHKLGGPSQWDAAELHAFRVISKVHVGYILPDLPPVKRHLFRGLGDITAPNPDRLPRRSEKDLIKTYGPMLGQFWAALRPFVPDNVSIERPRRNLSNNLPTTVVEAVDDDDDLASGMNNMTLKRQRSHESTTSYIEPMKGSATPQEPELVRQFIQYVLYEFDEVMHGKETPTDHPLENRFEWRENMATTVTIKDWHFSVIDDGGFELLRETGDTVDGQKLYESDKTGRGLVILEAKRSLTTFDDHGIPLISDKWLAQMTGEALGGHHIQGVVKQFENIYVIASAQQYMKLLRFKITDKYLEDVYKNEPVEILPVESTMWINLSRQEGRENALRNVLGLAQLTG